MKNKIGMVCHPNDCSKMIRKIQYIQRKFYGPSLIMFSVPEVQMLKVILSDSSNYLSPVYLCNKKGYIKENGKVCRGARLL